MLKGILFDIQRDSYMDGPGIRTTVFFKGCNLRCKWCHNPESQKSEKEILFYKNNCTDCGRCKDLTVNDENFLCFNEAKEICGKEYTGDEVLAEIIKDKAFYDNSGGGVTFSGGECMVQIDFLAEILRKCKENGIHTAVDTAGHIPFENFEKILPYTDLFLYDIKIFDSQKHKQYVGVGNGLIFENLKKLFERKIKLWIRIPIIADVNDNIYEIKSIKEFITGCGKPEKVELLPYHAMGEHKYRAIGKEPQIFKTPDAEKMKQLKQIFD